eukprot:TRINITY_DN828_c0_g1_i1.p1 TRINITY_DN828_c0_g1~~TRINITY_DN828_c0_g1_i1.p1  ORF type:complete len:237 (-),score=34.19 TRINITY_DN828_c0_g1_i1:49-759(-)
MDPDYPETETKNTKTMTQALRAFALYGHLTTLSKTKSELDVLILGPGLDKDIVPEWIEINALLWNNVVNFDVVDHDDQVLKAVKENKFYRVPDLTVGKGRTDDERNAKMPALEILLSVTSQDPNDPTQRIMDFSKTKHTLHTHQCDFTKFPFENSKYDVIVGLNSVFYLFNMPEFFNFTYAFLGKLINSLKIGGWLFFDKITYDIVSDWEKHGISGINVTNIGGWPNHTYKITRLH